MSVSPRDMLEIRVEYNTEDEAYGPVYVATSDEIGLITDGQTFEDLLANLREAIAACFDGTDTIAEFNIIPNPRIVIIPEQSFVSRIRMKIAIIRP